MVGGGVHYISDFLNCFIDRVFLICFTVAASRQNVPKRPTPCPNRKFVNSQEELIAKLIFFPSLRSESLCFFLVQACPRSLQRPHFLFSQNVFFLCASRGVFPNEGLSHHVSRLKTFFFPALRAVYVFFSPDASFPTNRMALPGLPHEQICSTWAS